ncbi:MAG: CRISPR-associated helicase Cas3' [Myxococcota bacterium]
MSGSHLHSNVFWGKLERDTQGQLLQWHPLVDHMIDVGVCCEALLERTILGQRLSYLAGCELSSAHVARLSVVAALHDIGKFNHGFQNKAIGKDPCAGHVQELLYFYQNPSLKEKLWAALEMQTLRSWSKGDGILRLLVAAISHHGKLLHMKYKPVGSYLWEPMEDRDPLKAMHDATHRLLQVFPAAREQAPPIPNIPAFHHVFAGVVMLADWLGSDTRLFRYTKSGDGPREGFARQQARLGLRKMGLDMSEARGELLGQTLGIQTITSYGTPRDAQKQVSSLPIVDGGDLLILEAETGAGKTEAALLRYLHLFREGKVDGMYFALPTRTAATQIHRRIQKAVARAFCDDESRPPVVLAVPGYLQVDDQQGVRLPHFRVLWSDDARWRYRGWAAEHPKRYLAGAIVVGTIDQVLLSTLKVHHAHLRAACLLRHLLVIDEVHASDAYMTRLLEEVLAHHRAAGGFAMLMSATLGVATQHRLLWPGKRKGAPTAPTLDESRRFPYPALRHLLFQDPDDAPMRPVSSDNGKDIQIHLRSWQDDHPQVAQRALEAAARGARVLIIRNTVRACLETQRALEQRATLQGQGHLLMRLGGVAVPHHSRYARPDRVLLDDAIEQAMRGAQQGGMVAVATQTVQQSLDLDADMMFSDLCPMDVLLQRFGRLHRHQSSGRPRPNGFEAATAIILTPDAPLSDALRDNGEVSGKHGIGSVYPDLCMLQATLEALQADPLISVPRQSRARVECTTHPDALQALAERMGPLWVKHRRRQIGHFFAHKGIASRSSVSWHEAVGTAAATFDRELDGDVVTRLGERDRVVNFEAPVHSALGQPIRQLNIPHWMAPQADGDELHPEDIEQDSNGFSFRLVRFRYQYTRLGLAKLKEDE